MQNGYSNMQSRKRGEVPWWSRQNSSAWNSQLNTSACSGLSTRGRLTFVASETIQAHPSTTFGFSMLKSRVHRLCRIIDTHICIVVSTPCSIVVTELCMYTQSSQEWYCGRPYSRRLLAVGQIPASGPAEQLGLIRASWIVRFSSSSLHA